MEAEKQTVLFDDVVYTSIETTPKLKSIVEGNTDGNESRISFDVLFNLFYQRLAEVYFLEKIRAAKQKIPYPIELIDIPDGLKIGKYLYKKNQLGNLQVLDSETNEFVTDIDGIVAISETLQEDNRWLPFVVEVKMAAFGHCRGSREVDSYFNPLTRYIKIPYSLKAIDPVLAYFRELYRKGEIYNKPNDIGIIVGMPPDRVDLIREGSQRKFVQRGGNIIRSHINLKEYRQFINSVVTERFQLI